MPFIFKDDPKKLEFTLVEDIKKEGHKSTHEKFKFNITLFELQQFYRQVLLESYKAQSTSPLFPDDIKLYPKTYLENSKSSAKEWDQNPIRRYAIDVSTNAFNVWYNSGGKMQCYIAYRNVGGRQSIEGFVLFTETTLGGKPVVYIAEAGVKTRGQGTGQRLIKCVLGRFLIGTEFWVLTRIFNKPAKYLYEKLEFTGIEAKEVEALGYSSEKYCGYKCVTLEKDISAINALKASTSSITSESKSEERKAPSKKTPPVAPPTTAFTPPSVGPSQPIRKASQPVPSKKPAAQSAGTGPGPSTNICPIKI